MPFLIQEEIEVDGRLLVDRHSPVEVNEVLFLEKTVKLDGREVLIRFTFDPPLVPRDS